MRIIGGEAKGRRIKTCKGIRTRPTADRVKETIFNLIGKSISGVRVLDLFAGSGSLGLEALSRGASQALFLDSSRPATSVVEENLAALGFEERAEVVRGDVFRLIPWLARRDRRFGIVFVDPPYDRGFAQKTVRLLNRFPILEEHGMVVVEHSKREAMRPGTFLTHRKRAFGDTIVTILVLR